MYMYTDIIVGAGNSFQLSNYKLWPISIATLYQVILDYWYHKLLLNYIDHLDIA